MDYEEKLRLAKDLYNKVRLLSSPEARETGLTLEKLFPELREIEDEDEDERIREALLNTVKYYHPGESPYMYGISNESVIAWLEKQKEQKPIQKYISWTELTWEDINTLECIINNVHYEFRNGIGEESFGKEVLERFRESKGDEHVDALSEQKIAEWSEKDEMFLYNIIRDLESLYKEAVVEQLKDVYSNEIDWLKSIKDRVQPQPKQEWSEEDERHYEGCLAFFKGIGTCSPYYQDYLWLKSLQVKTTNSKLEQKWSEKDVTHINYITMLLEDKKKEYTESGKKNIEREIDWLNHWRPSEV